MIAPDLETAADFLRRLVDGAVAPGESAKTGRIRR